MTDKSIDKNKKLSKDMINFQNISSDDIDFLYTVYRSTRIDEIGIVHWPEKEKEEFLKSQFTLQHTQYMQNYKNASFEIILFDNTPVGRIYINWEKDDTRIIDIAFLKEYRNKGIGSKILNDLIEKSVEKKISLSLHVEYYNFAKEWYEKLGFKVVRESGVYFFMVRNPQNS
ncbi:MAG: GNAT family N-acetyltransferase [Halanaerobiales bacterium]|nr:GNAT family N-acetyltransferase [Halanaerobiales bacterium]